MTMETVEIWDRDISVVSSGGIIPFRRRAEPAGASENAKNHRPSQSYRGRRATSGGVRQTANQRLSQRPNRPIFLMKPSGVAAICAFQPIVITDSRPS